MLYGSKVGNVASRTRFFGLSLFYACVKRIEKFENCKIEILFSCSRAVFTANIGAAESAKSSLGEKTLRPLCVLCISAVQVMQSICMQGSSALRISNLTTF